MSKKIHPSIHLYDMSHPSIHSSIFHPDLTPRAELWDVRYPMMPLFSFLHRMGLFLWQMVSRVWSTALAVGLVAQTDSEKRTGGKKNMSARSHLNSIYVSLKRVVVNIRIVNRVCDFKKKNKIMTLWHSPLIFSIRDSERYLSSHQNDVGAS